MDYAASDAESAANAEDLVALAKGGGIALFGRLTSRGFQLAIQILLARLLGPLGYGLYSIGWNVFQIGSRIGPMGLQNGVVHFGARCHKDDPDRFRHVVWISVGISSVIGVFLASAIAIGAPFLAIEVFNDAEVVVILRGFAVALAFGIALRVTASASRITYRMQFSAVAEDIIPYGGNLLLILLFFVIGGIGITEAVNAVVLSHILGWLLSIIFLIHLFPSLRALVQFRWQIAKELLSYSLPVFLAGIFTFLIMWSTALFVGAFMDSEAVGIFQVASQASLLVAVILGAVRQVFAPMSSRLYHAQEIRRLGKAYGNNTRWGIYLSLPLLVLMLIAPENMVGALFGGEYLFGASLLPVLVIGQLVNAVAGGVDYLLVMTGHQRDWFLLTFGSFLLAAAVNILLIPRLGLMGAALGNSIGIVSLYIGGLILVEQRLGVLPVDLKFLRTLPPFIVAAGAAIFLHRAVGGGGILHLILLFSVQGLIAYVGLMLLTPYADDREVVAQALERVGRFLPWKTG